MAAASATLAALHGPKIKPDFPQTRLHTWRRPTTGALLLAVGLATSGFWPRQPGGPSIAGLPPVVSWEEPQPELGATPLPLAMVGGEALRIGRWLKRNTSEPGSGSHNGLFQGLWRPCALAGGTCNCIGTIIFGTALGKPVRVMNSDGAVQCTAEALGSNSHRDLRICWCQEGVAWGDEVRKGLASLVRSGLVPRVEIASDEAAEPNCSAESDGLWYGCIVMSRRWDTTVIPQVLMRATPPEEQLDMSLRMLDACHRLAPGATLRVLGVRSGQAADALELPVALAQVCSVVYSPREGTFWTAETRPIHCATQPGTCTTTPCECRRAQDRKLELTTPQGQRCYACAKPGTEYRFRVNALAEQMEGSSLSWWPPYGINCPPILWVFMDWRAVVGGCPVITCYMAVFFVCLLVRRGEELSGGWIPWTRVTPLFGPTLKRGELWRLFTFTFFHLQFLEVFQNLLTLLDTLDVEGTPAIVLGDGSNLKCGVGAKENFMCYPSIGIGSYHTLGVALVSTAVGGMCSTWITFRGVVTGATALGFGFSGAIVALYALYAGAELDQTTSVQRSFQDWVWLRLIFVGFHVAMEWIRGLSQKDAAGLFAHTASFAAGFAYVLHFLPPMGDGTLLPSNRPYIVPCTYDVHGGQFADSSVPECVRLFSQLYEYQVPVVRQNALLLFTATVAFTVLNTAVLKARVPANEAVLLAGMEVSAVSCTRRKGGGPVPSWRSSNLEGKRLILWCEVIGAIGLPGSESGLQPLVEVRCFRSDPRRDQGGSLEQGAEASRMTRSVEAGSEVQWRESLFLPVKFSKGAFVQLVLRNGASEEREVLALHTLPITQAVRFSRQDFSDQRLRLQAVGEGGAITGKVMVHVRFRCLDLSELMRLRVRVKDEVDTRRNKLGYYQEQLTALQQIQESIAASSAAVEHISISTQPSSPTHETRND